MNTRTSLSRRIAGALTVSALALGAGLSGGALSPAAADPMPTGSLSGTVVADGGAPIPNARVTLYKYDGSDGSYRSWDSTRTGLSGDFLFTYLDATSYKVEFSASGYQYEYYANTTDFSSAAALTVGTGNTAVPAASLAPEAPWVTVDADTDVTGIVSDGATGKPTNGIEVRAQDPTTGNYIDSANTDTAGRYQLDDLDGHASVKLSFSDDDRDGADLGYLSSYLGGAKTRAASPSVVLTPGTPVVASMALTRAAGISGRVVNAAGAAPLYGEVEIYDMDTEEWSETSLRADGTFFVNWLNPGESYKVRFTDTYDYPGNDWDANARYYFDMWYADGNDFSSAATVTAGAPGTWTSSINVTLRDSLVALEAPSVSGDVVVGKTLTGNRGRWNRNGDAVFGYEWLRGSTVVGTGSTYTLTAADAGQSIALRVTNTVVVNEESRTATVTTAAKVAKYASSVSAKAKTVKKGKKSAAKVTVSVKAGAQAASKVTGTVTVTEGKKKVATAKVVGGTATFTVTQPGKHTYALAYSGNGTMLGAQGKATVTVKKAKPGKKGKGKKK